ncbi:MAG: hypothetical protein QM538_07595 [Methylacidiphilales bacterium]|nr:hypothetical protein [Candidatus Methylacidiphilales bacterium]
MNENAQNENIQDELERLRRENSQLKQKVSSGAKAISLKVSEKGGVSLYGLGRFPVTLYLEQWEKLLGHTEEIKRFINENRNSLKTKGD